MYNFIRGFEFNITKKNFRKALELTRAEMRSYEVCGKGTFFKILLLQLNHVIGWEFAEDMEDALLSRLE
ncbi:MAG: hypothetical protein HYT72_02725 [Candidatus Aenigmarchaeota archaeon]|nr:hypothetical protein [Candidatus Aenigmarchaeota archaeon]